MIRPFALFVIIFGGIFAFAQEHTVPCCNCGSDSGVAKAICLRPDQIRARVRHMEPLRTSGLDRNLNLVGTLIVEVRFGTDGKVECARAIEGNPIAISAAMLALPKWTFKPLTSGGSAQPGCGRLTIRYRLSSRSSSTKLQQ